MINPENHPIMSYAGNLLVRVGGVEAYKQTKREALAAGCSDASASVYGAKDLLIKLLFLPTLNSRDIDRDHNIRSGTIIGLKVGLIEWYMGIMAPIDIGLRTNSITAAVATRVAYHFAVEVVPDALRAVRRNAHSGSGSIPILS